MKSERLDSRCLSHQQKDKAVSPISIRLLTHVSRQKQENVENTGKEGESGENIKKNGKQVESGENIEKLEKTGRIRGKHRKTWENRENQRKT